MSVERIVAGLLLLTLSTTWSLAGAANDEQQMLLEKARYWEDRGRLDMAADSWQKLLLVDPAQPEALAGLGVKAAMSGDIEQAEHYLSELRSVAPKHPGRVRIRQAISYSKLDQVLLAKARNAAAEGDYPASVAYYRELLGDMTPEGDLALEYLTTLAGIEEQWPQARQGLEQLVTSVPDEERYRLALAKHLSYRQATRREAIGMLRSLASDPRYGTDAKAAWRQALLWLKDKPADARLYEQYLAKNPSDKAVSRRLAELRNPDLKLDPLAKQAKAGYRALESGDLAKAEAAFGQVLRRNKKHADALAGMGIIRLRQERFQDAERYLRQASKYAKPSQRRRYAKSLDSARLWVLVEQARVAESEGGLTAAQRDLREAISLAPQQAEPRVALAGVLAKQGRLREAESQYRQVLKGMPQHVAASLGLIRLLHKDGRFNEANRLADTLVTAHPGKDFDLGGLRADVLREQAEDALALGRQAQAKAYLEQALLEKPGDPWVRLRLAQILHQQGKSEEADSLLDGLLQSNPDMPEALYVKALMSNQLGHWWEGLKALERILEDARSSDMQSLYRQMSIQAELERAVALVRQGQQRRAGQALLQLEDKVDDEPALLPAVAATWDEIGDTGRGIVLLRKAMAGPAALTPGFRLMYASLLLKTGQDTELDVLLDQLSRDRTLDAVEREELAKLKRGLAIRQADQARQAGDLAAAYEHLRPFLYESPIDVEVLTALGRIYQQDGREREAFAYYEEALRSDPTNLSAMQAVIGVAIASQHYERAAELVADAHRQHPETAEVYILEGRLEQARGNDHLAIAAFRHARELRGGVVDEGGGEFALPADEYRALADRQQRFAVNPFARTDPRPAARTASRPAYADQGGYTARRVQAREPAYGRQYAALDQRDAGVSDVPGSRYRGTPVQSSREQDPYADRPRATDARYAAAEDAHEPSENTPPTLDEEIARIESRHSPQLGGGYQMRLRDGEEGLSNLVDIQLPMEFAFSPGYRGRLVGRVVPVFLDAGDLNLGNLGLARRFGSNALDASLPQSRQVAQQQSGVAFSLGYRWKGLNLDVGTTPLGFEQSSLVGGIGWRPLEGKTRLGLELSRRAVTDSLLSYAGTQDPRTGASVGGVTRTGGRVDMGLERLGTGIYASAAYYLLDGQGVESNHQYKLGGGAYWRLLARPDQRITMGLDLTLQGYDKNLGFYTLGHGGYFSPDWYVGLQLPVEWTGREGSLAYRLAGGLGIQSFREESAPYYPGSSALQSQLAAQALLDPTLQTSYAGQSVTGLMFNLAGEFEYRLASRLHLGGQLGFDNASDYNEFGLGLYLRYWFEPQSSRIGFPPKPLRPFAEGNPF